MPQLDSSTFMPQLFWLAVFFLFILIFSARVTLPRLTQVLRHRWEMIEGTQQVALNLQKEADIIQQTLNQEIAQARKKAHDQIVMMNQQITQEQSQKRLELIQHMKHRLQEHELRVAHQKAAVMGDVQFLVKDIAKAIVGKIVGETISADMEKAIEASIGMR